jgi:hypothetical protein
MLFCSTAVHHQILHCQLNSFHVHSHSFLLYDQFNIICSDPEVPGPRGPRFDSWHYQIFWAAVGLELGPFSLVSINEELLEKK